MVLKLSGNMPGSVAPPRREGISLDHDAALRALLEADVERMRLLALVRSLSLPDCWIGAGFVREAVWDALHGRPSTPPSSDVDVVWFDQDRTAPEEDRGLAARLAALDGAVRWSVKNQARMHRRNGDAPYVSATDAMRHWPETATAIGARLTAAGGCELAAPLGLDDLFDLVVRPTQGFRGEKRSVVLERVRSKGWLERWNRLRLAS
jgi:uncharacterized protein